MAGKAKTEVPKRRVIHIPAKSARAFEVKERQTVRIIDVQGTQCGDFIAFSSADRREFFSQSRTRTNNWKICVTTSDKLFSNRDNVMFTIGEDLVRKHDIILPECNRYVFREIYKVGERTGCQEHLAAALEKYGFTLDDIHDPFNVFMDTGFDEAGQIVIRRGPSKAGDYVDLIAEMDMLAALSACAVDLGEANGGVCTDLRVEIFPT